MENIFKNIWCRGAFSMLETFVQGQNEQLPQQQMHPDRYKQNQLWFLRADPRGLSEGKKAPGRLSSWPLPASVRQHGALLLVYDQYKQGCIRSLASPAPRKGKFDTGAPGVTRILLCCCKSRRIRNSNLFLSGWPGGKQVCPVFCWHTRCFTSDVIPSNSEGCLWMLHQRLVMDALPMLFRVILPEVSCALTACQYLTAVDNLKSAPNWSVFFPFTSVCAHRITVGCSFPSVDTDCCRCTLHQEVTSSLRPLLLCRSAGCSAVEPAVVTYDRWLARTDSLPDRFEISWAASRLNLIK